MKNKELIRQLEEVQKKKTRLKQLTQESFDLIHEIEVGIQLILLDKYKGKK